MWVKFVNVHNVNSDGNVDTVALLQIWFIGITTYYSDL